MSPRVLLVHGAATTSGVWDQVIGALRARGIHDVEAVQRPCSGNLHTEIAFLADRADGALVVGQSGGATLALALAASDVGLAGAVCHEPAVGSLLPELLAPMAAAFATGGAEAFGMRLYGASWSIADAGADPDAVARELPMFRGFEPARSRQAGGSVIVTVGELSPPIRHQAAAQLTKRLGYPSRTVPGGGHFVARDAPDEFADLVADHARHLLA